MNYVKHFGGELFMYLCLNGTMFMIIMALFGSPDAQIALKFSLFFSGLSTLILLIKNWKNGTL